jgi:NAD(P)H-hydrate epimerase
VHLVTASEMQAIDRETIAGGYAGALDLMESAGAAVAHEALAMVSARRGARIEIVCGKGNNGGDGLVVARHLAAAGMRVRVHLTHALEALTPEARSCAERLRDTDVAVHVLPPALDGSLAAALREADLCVDAVLGTGVTGKLRGGVAAVVTALAGAPGATLAIDIPSGIDGDTGAVCGVAARADATVTFGAPKIGHAFHPGRARCGRLVVADIGFPDPIVAAHAAGRQWVDRDAARRWLPHLDPVAHKYARGAVVIVAGSRSYTGAAALAAMAALRAGAGIVHLVTPEGVRAILQQKLTEVIVHGVAETSDGGIAAAAASTVRDLLPRARALVLGPGLGEHSEAQACVAAILAAASIPAVVDADALAALHAGSAHRAARIVTPHAGELARWTGEPVPEPALDRMAHARAVAAARDVVLLAKGAPTLVADARGSVYVNSTGHAGLATAGTGDVLAGIAGGLLAQGADDAGHAAALAAWLHGRAAEIACRGRSPRSLVAGDLLISLGEALHEVEP